MRGTYLWCVMIRTFCVIWMDVSFVHSLHLVRQVGGKLTHIKVKRITDLCDSLSHPDNYFWKYVEYCHLASARMDLSVILREVDASKQHIRQIAIFSPSRCIHVRFNEFFLTHSRITHCNYIPRIVWTLHKSNAFSENLIRTKFILYKIFFRMSTLSSSKTSWMFFNLHSKIMCLPSPIDNSYQLAFDHFLVKGGILHQN